MGCHALLQGIFPTPGLNLQLLQLRDRRKILYRWATWEAPRVALLELKSPTWWLSTRKERRPQKNLPDGYDELVRWIESSATSVSRCEATPGWWETHTSPEGGGRWKTQPDGGGCQLSPAPGTPSVQQDGTPGVPGPHRAHPQVLSCASQVQPEPWAAQDRSTGCRRSQTTGSTDTCSGSTRFLQICAG